MDDDASERAAVSIVRAWIEPPGGDRLRVRVSQTLDLGAPDESSSRVVSSIDEACDLVRTWLVAFVEGPARRRPRDGRRRPPP